MLADDILQNLTPYHSPSWLIGGHMQTIWPKFLPLPKINYRRELIADSSALTQVAYDFAESNPQNDEITVLFHGLEGSSQSHYALSLMNTLLKKQRNGVVSHYRSCGDVPNTAPIFYHMGDFKEVGHVLSVLKQRYDKIYAVGVSLGGNVLARYLADTQDKALCEAAVIISTPFKIAVSAEAFKHFIAQHIYSPYFLKTLRPKILEICADTELCKKMLHCRSLTEFDDMVTAPLHGFLSSDDYYQKASSFAYLKQIKKPSLLINAQNDPFYYPEALPTKQDVSEHVYLLQPKTGGHAGFISGKKGDNLNWLAETSLRFFDTIKSISK